MPEETLLTRAPKLRHVLRHQPPWRPNPTPRAECGRHTTDTDLVWTQEEFASQLASLGQQRLSLHMCMVCMNTLGNRNRFRQPNWGSNPVEIIHRETLDYIRSGATDGPLAQELRALALLAQRHPEEFNQALQDLSQVTPLHARRRPASRRSR